MTGTGSAPVSGSSSLRGRLRLRPRRIGRARVQVVTAAAGSGSRLRPQPAASCRALDGVGSSALVWPAAAVRLGRRQLAALPGSRPLRSGRSSSGSSGSGTRLAKSGSCCGSRRRHRLAPLRQRNAAEGRCQHRAGGAHGGVAQRVADQPGRVGEQPLALAVGLLPGRRCQLVGQPGWPAPRRSATGRRPAWPPGLP